MNSEDLLNGGKVTTYRFGGFVLEADNLLLLRGAEVVPLAPKAIEVLIELVKADGNLITKQQLINNVWPDSFVEEANLTHHISALRKAFGEEKVGRKFIETIPRRGYRFVAPVNEEERVSTEIIISERVTVRAVEEVKLESYETGIAPSVAQPKPVILSRQLAMRRWWMVVAALSGLVVFAGASYGIYRYLDQVPRRFNAKSVVRLTSSGKILKAAVSPDGKFVIYAQEEPNRQQSLRLRHIGSESTTVIAAPVAIDFRGLKIAPDGNSFYYLDGEGSLFNMPTLGGTARKISSGSYTYPVFPFPIGISPDGTQIAVVRRTANKSTTLYAVQADGSGERAIVTIEQPNAIYQSTDWSPDGKTIACHAIMVGVQTIFAVNVADGTYKSLLTKLDIAVGGLAWLPDSDSIIFSASNRVLSTRDGDVLINDAWELYGDVSLTADGNLLSVVKTEATANIWTMSTDDPGGLRKLTSGVKTFEGTDVLAFGQNGEIVHNVSGTDSFVIKSFDPASSISKELFKGSFDGCLSPDGRFFVYQKPVDNVELVGLFKVDLNDGSEKRLTTGIDVGETISPDGTTVYFTRWGEKVSLWKVPFDGGEATEVLRDEIALAPAVSPDGRTVAFVLKRAGDIQRIALVSTAGGEITKVFDMDLADAVIGYYPLQWTADGSGIYFLAGSDRGANIWRQPIDGSEPEPVTNFRDGRIFNFVYSKDEKQIAFSRGSLDTNIILVENGE